MRTLTREMQKAITPQSAIKILKNGNERFINNLKISRNLLQQVNETSAEQNPFAVILSCIDSRTSAELIFDQGLGDILSIRVGGNIINEDVLGSMEFGCKLIGAKIIVVLGHSQCGAIKGACDHLELGNITTLLNKIKPVVDQEHTIKSNRSSNNPEFVEKVASRNVYHVMNEIKIQSPIIKELVDSGQCLIIGGMYDISTGKVTFYENR